MSADDGLPGLAGGGKMGVMTSLKDTLKADLTTAMKARDEIRTRTLRMALAAVSTEEVAGKEARALSDDEIVKVLTKEAKKRREASEAFAGAGRAEQAQAELDEQAVLEAYLPAQLSDEELNRLVEEAIAESGAEGPKAMGQVMKILNPKVAGRAEGGRVAQAVRGKLAG
ncbi:GatB/YqeY domain-containing protein [Sphaerisporangium rubeum]